MGVWHINSKISLISPSIFGIKFFSKATLYISIRGVCLVISIFFKCFFYFIVNIYLLPCFGGWSIK